jgi:anti-sigma B factor antagonist
MSLAVEISRRDDASGRSASVVRLVGELDSRTAAEAQRALAILAESGSQAVIFDLERLRFLDSSGITVLLASRIAFRRKGVSVFLTNLTRQVRRALEIVQALPDVRIFQSMEEFDAYLADVQREGSGSDEGG